MPEGRLIGYKQDGTPVYEPRSGPATPWLDYVKKMRTTEEELRARDAKAGKSVGAWQFKGQSDQEIALRALQQAQDPRVRESFAAAYGEAPGFTEADVRKDLSGSPFLDSFLEGLDPVGAYNPRFSPEDEVSAKRMAGLMTGMGASMLGPAALRVLAPMKTLGKVKTIAKIGQALAKAREAHSALDKTAKVAGATGRVLTNQRLLNAAQGATAAGVPGYRQRGESGADAFKAGMVGGTFGALMGGGPATWSTPVQKVTKTLGFPAGMMGIMGSDPAAERDYEALKEQGATSELEDVLGPVGIGAFNQRKLLANPDVSTGMKMGLTLPMLLGMGSGLAARKAPPKVTPEAIATSLAATTLPAPVVRNFDIPAVEFEPSASPLGPQVEKSNQLMRIIEDLREASAEYPSDLRHTWGLLDNTGVPRGEIVSFRGSYPGKVQFTLKDNPQPQNYTLSGLEKDGTRFTVPIAVGAAKPTSVAVDPGFLPGHPDMDYQALHLMLGNDRVSIVGHKPSPGENRPTAWQLYNRDRNAMMTVSDINADPELKAAMDNAIAARQRKRTELDTAAAEAKGKARQRAQEMEDSAGPQPLDMIGPEEYAEIVDFMKALALKRRR